jgi:gas vesicle protein
MGGDAMTESSNQSIGSAMLMFAAGVAIGGLLVALNTPKTGPELREDLRRMGRRARDRAEDLGEEAERGWERVKGRAGGAAEAAGREIKED